MEKLILTKQQARKFLLAYQGIWPQSDLEEKLGIVDYIRRVVTNNALTKNGIVVLPLFGRGNPGAPLSAYGQEGIEV